MNIVKIILTILEALFCIVAILITIVTIRRHFNNSDSYNTICDSCSHLKYRYKKNNHFHKFKCDGDARGESFDIAPEYCKYYCKRESNDNNNKKVLNKEDFYWGE